MRNSKGISMVTLVITIVVMMILLSIAFVVNNDGTERADIAKIENEKQLLQQALQARCADYIRNPQFASLEGEKVEPTLDAITSYLSSSGRETTNDSEVRTEITTFLQKNDKWTEYIRIIDYSDMLGLGLTNISHKTDYSYVVNYYSLDIVGPIE